MATRPGKPPAAADDPRDPGGSDGTDLRIRHDVAGPADVVTLEGDLDIYTRDTVQDHLAALAGRGRHRFVLDLNGVTFLDARGLAVLFDAIQHARANGGWVDVGCSAQRILKLLREMGMQRMVGVYDTADEALAARGIDHDIAADVTPQARHRHRRKEVGRLAPQAGPMRGTLTCLSHAPPRCILAGMRYAANAQVSLGACLRALYGRR